MPRLTAKFIIDIRNCPSGQIIIRDDELLGFGVRVGKTCKSYIVETRDGAKVKRITIGRCDLIPVESARSKARGILARMASQRASSRTSGPSLAEVVDKYVASRRLRPNTIRCYRQLTKRCLGDWFDLPIGAITPEMVQQRHNELARPSRRGTSGESQANKAMEVLGILINFAAQNCETSDGQPAVLVNPVKQLSKHKRWFPSRHR